MSDRPLASVLTCSNLATRAFPNGKVGWYAACNIGDEAARRQLAEAARRQLAEAPVI